MAKTTRAQRTYAFANMMFRQLTRCPPADDATAPAPIGGILISDHFRQQVTQAGVPPYVVSQTARQIARWYGNTDGAYPCGQRQAIVTNGALVALR